MSALPQLVRARRKALALTQQQAADAGGLSVATWGNVESGRLPEPPATTAHGIATALGWTRDSVSRILRGMEPIEADRQDRMAQALEVIRSNDPAQYEALALIIERAAFALAMRPA